MFWGLVYEKRRKLLCIFRAMTLAPGVLVGMNMVCKYKITSNKMDCVSDMLSLNGKYIIIVLPYFLD